MPTVTIEEVIKALQDLNFAQGFENNLDSKEYDEKSSFEDLQAFLIDAQNAEKTGDEEKKDEEEDKEEKKDEEEKKEYKKEDVLTASKRVLIGIIKDEKLYIDTTQKVHQVRRELMIALFDFDIGDEQDINAEKKITIKENVASNETVKVKLISNIKKNGKTVKAGTIYSSPYETVERLIEIGVAKIVK